MYIKYNQTYYKFNFQLDSLGNCCGAGVCYGVSCRVVDQRWDRYDYTDAQSYSKQPSTVREAVELLAVAAINEMSEERRALFVLVDAVGGERVQDGLEPVDLYSDNLRVLERVTTYHIMQTLLEWQKNKDKRLPSNFEISDMGTFINPNTDHELQAIQIVIRYDKEDRDYYDDYYDSEY